MSEALALVVILALVAGIVIVYRGGAIDRDKARAALEARGEDARGWVERLIAKIRDR